MPDRRRHQRPDLPDPGRPAQDLEALPIVTVQSSELRPLGAFAAVNYRGTWFHVDDSDFRSKRVFSVLMLILNLVENIGGEQLPVITIPSG